MAVKASKNPTLLDLASRMVDGSVEKEIIEMLAETNEMMEDMTFVECNDGTSHKTTIRSGLPEATWRELNYGVQPSKSKTKQIKDATGMLEAYAEIDKALADLNGNTADFRMSEDAAHIEAMNQGFMDTVIYGNTAIHPQKFMGLAPRFNSLTAENGQNIIDCGGTGSDNTSVWLVVWGKKTAHGLYPKGSKAGLQMRDLGEHTLEDADGGKYQGYRSHYKWDPGLTVRDWRYVVRLANIDVSALTKDAASGVDLVDKFTEALELLPPGYAAAGHPVFYCNRTVRSYLRRQIKNAKNMNLTLETVAGKPVVAFDGVPVKRVDAILNTEAQVV
ncbi:major capsid protein [Bdellovibrio bacteriovorus]